MLTEQSRGSKVDGQTKPMKHYTYSVTVHDGITGKPAVVSDAVKAKPLVAVSRAFTAYPQTIEIWDGEEIIHAFDLAVGEDIVHFAEAELEDLPFQGSEDDAAVIGAICKDILFIR